MKRVIAAVALTLLSITACAEDAGSTPEYQAGTHYQVLPAPVPTRDAEKIEVTEVFWYGCGHCFNFEPVVHQWAKQLPDDVYVDQSPAIWGSINFKDKPLDWGNPMAIHARAYFTAQALGVLDEVHTPIFKALNVEKKKLASADELAELFAAHGVDKDTFIRTYASFGITSQTQRAYSRVLAYKITGTPELIVNGKYRVSGRMAGSQANMLKVAEFLIAKERMSN